MKKIMAMILCVVMLVGVLAGCGAQSNSTAAPSGPQRIEGTLQAFSGSVVTLNTLSGKILLFDVTNATLNNTDGMLAGDDIVLTYTGTITDTDTSDAEVLSVDDLTENSAAPAQYTMQGTLQEATMNTITITDVQSGTAYTFTTAGAEMDIYNGLEVGDTIQVTYIGELISADDCSDIQVVRVVDNDVNQDIPAAPQMTITATHETVYAKGDVNVRSGAGVDFPRIGGLKNGESVLRTGVCSNGWSRVQFGGKEAYIYTEYLTLSKPTVNPTVGASTLGASRAPAAAQPAQPTTTPQPSEVFYSVSGYVKDVSMNSITVDSNGLVLTFGGTQSATHHYKNGILLGNYVTIEYSGLISGNDTSKTTVHTISDEDPNNAPAPAAPASSSEAPASSSSAPSSSAPAPASSSSAPSSSTPAPSSSSQAPVTTTPSGPASSEAPIGQGAGPASSEAPIGQGAGPVSSAAPAPVTETAPEPVVESTPAPVETAPAPVVESTPAPVETAPAPVVESTPAPVVESTPAPAPVVETPPAPAPIVSAAGPVSAYIVGTVTASTGNTVTIQTDDGATITYTITDDTTNNCANGITVGNSITVYPGQRVDGTGVLPALALADA